MAIPKLSLSRQEAAAATGVSVDTIARAIRSGALRAKKSSVNKDGDPAGIFVIRVSDLEAWLEGMSDA